MEALHSATGREEFLKTLMGTYGIKEKQLWENNNGTLSQEAYIIDVRDMREVAGIISKLSTFNKTSNQPPLIAVPVAGWAAPDPTISFISEETRDEHLVAEYAKSFSLSPFTTGKNADVIIRISKEAQKVHVFDRNGKKFLQITPGCRITDIERELARHNLALRPHMTTLHVASWVGAAANGCYGPGKNYTSMTTDIIEMKVITPFGEELTLSATEKSNLFYILRDCHMGAGFIVTELIIENIEADFLLQRTDRLLENVEEFSKVMQDKKLLEKEHFIMHYMPAGMNHKKGHHFPRFRVSTFKRTSKTPTEISQAKQDLSDYKDLELTSFSEPFIKDVVNSKLLQPFFDIVLEAAARKTFGHAKKQVQIGPSAQTIHILKTYTESPLIDVNWLIQVRDAHVAQDILVKLMTKVEEKLKSCAKSHEFPVLTIYARYLKGIYYTEGKGGVAATAVDQPDYSILSFELLTYPPLQKKEGFKEIQNDVIRLLEENHLKFKYHPGKTWPDNLTSLTQLFTDSIDVKKLHNYQEAIIALHGGLQNIPFSPFLTPQKKEFIGLNIEHSSEKTKISSEEIKKGKLTQTQKKEALETIAKAAKELGHLEKHEKAKSLAQELEKAKK